MPLDKFSVLNNLNHYYYLGLDAITRRERAEDYFFNPENEHLHARDEDDSNPPPEVTEPSWDFFKVSQDDCNTKWSKEMDGWELFDVKSLDCPEDSIQVH